MHGLQPYQSGNLPGGGGGGSGAGGVQLSPTRIVKTDGSTLKMRGLPFRATPEEIMAFFDGFKVWDLTHPFLGCPLGIFRLLQARP